MAYDAARRRISIIILSKMAVSYPKDRQKEWQQGSAVIIAVLLGLFAVIILRRAWVGDDAYITFRTVDNFIQGYGLTWNVGERVQAYTHPLWMFLLSLGYFFTREIFYTSIIISAAVSLAAVGLNAMRIAKSTLAAGLGMLVLGLSNAFVDYSTSGLENPLTHLLMAVFLVLFLGRPATPRRLFWLSLVASLAGVNRMDTLVIYAPALLVAWWQTPRRWRELRWAALGQAPFILWEVFSIVYYGFPFPNTAYAKLNTGVPGDQLAVQGFFYLLNSLQMDPITLAAVAGGVGAGLTSRRARETALALGVLLYLAYTVKIGGDFMSGRFLTAPLFASVALIGFRLPRSLGQRPAEAAALLLAALALGLLAPLPTYRIDIPTDYPKSDAKRINDERAWYWADVSLIGRSRANPFPTSQGRESGLAARAAGELDYTVLPVNNVGLFGFYAGANVYAIDQYALADPLLARLPAEREANFYVGHFHRVIPDGYLSSLYSGNNLIEDENLAKFYDSLRLVVRGSLFSAERWRAIWQMNTGQLNALIDVERYRYPQRQSVAADAVSPQKPLEFGDSGVLVDLGGSVQPQSVELALDSRGAFTVLLLLNGQKVEQVAVSPVYGLEALASYRVPVGGRAVDQLWILPDGGSKDNLYHLAGVSIK